VRGVRRPSIASSSRAAALLHSDHVGVGPKHQVDHTRAPCRGRSEASAARSGGAQRCRAPHSPVAAWLKVMDPISEVQVMGGLHNTLRRLVVDGRPVALGLHAVGDAVCTTNPVGGRGISLALRSVSDLTDVLAAPPRRSVGAGDQRGRCRDAEHRSLIRRPGRRRPRTPRCDPESAGRRAAGIASRHRERRHPRPTCARPA
jgi:hypothetical protein